MKFYMLTVTMGPDTEAPRIFRKIFKNEDEAHAAFEDTSLVDEFHLGHGFSKKAIKNLNAKGLTMIESRFEVNSAEGESKDKDEYITLETFDEPDDVYNAKLKKLKEASAKAASKKKIDPNAPVKLKKDKKTSDEIVDEIIKDIDRTNREYDEAPF